MLGFSGAAPPVAIAKEKSRNGNGYHGAAAAATALAVNGNGHKPMPRVSVVIPALNEAKNIPLVFANLPPDVFEVILVDGESTDGTTEVALAIRPDVRIVSEPRPG